MQDKPTTTGKDLVPVTETAKPFTKTEARKHIEKMKAAATAMWEMAVEAYERKAWLALGYDSFADLIREEFGYGKAQAYRMLDAGFIARELSPPPPPVESPIGDWRTEAREQEKQRRIFVVTREFPSDTTAPPPTRLAQTQELKPISCDRELLVTTWKEVVEQHGPDPTGRQVRKVVRAGIDERKRPEDKLPHRLREIDRDLGQIHWHAVDLDADLDDERWAVEDGLLSDTPREILDRWCEEANESQAAIARVLERLVTLS